MTNKCEGYLFVTGPKEDIRRFREFARDGEKVLNVQKFSHSHVHQPPLWDCLDTEIENESDYQVEYRFNLSYSIHSDVKFDPIIEQMVEIFPSLVFDCSYERGPRIISRGHSLPNLCGAMLFVKGPELDLKKFKRAASKGELPLKAENFIPYPEQFEDHLKFAHLAFQMCEPLYNKFISEGMNEDIAWKMASEESPIKFERHDYGVRDWCIKNWGTWPGVLNAFILHEYYDQIDYNFFTYCTPIKPVINKMSMMFPTLTFIYDFQGPEAGFNARYSVVKGSVIKDKRFDPSSDGETKEV
jgi:hypothetical protein